MVRQLSDVYPDGLFGRLQQREQLVDVSANIISYDIVLYGGFLVQMRVLQVIKWILMKHSDIFSDLNYYFICYFGKILSTIIPCETSL